MIDSIKRRLRQQSTWFGIAGVAIYVVTGYNLDPATIGTLLTGIGLIAADA